MKEIKLAIFDFDGTLVDSNNIKKNAFIDFFRKHNIKIEHNDLKHQRDIILYNSGIFNNKSEEKIFQIKTELNNFLNSEVSKAERIDSTFKLLKKFRNMNIFIILSSATPQISLITQVLLRDWLLYFDYIVGYPQDKSNTVKELMKKFRVDKEKTIIIGDGEDDYKSAKDNNVDFYYVGDDQSIMNNEKVFSLDYL